MPTREEVLTRVRAKYPQYGEVDDNALASALSAKYPQYREMLNQTPEQSAQVERVEKTEAMANTKEPQAGQIPDSARATGLGGLKYAGPVGYSLDYFLKSHPELSEKVQSFTEGALNTTTAGISDLIAKKSGADLNSAESPRFRQPYSNAVGEVGGAFTPSLGFKGANTIGSVIKAGAKTGGAYGLVSGATSKAMDDNATKEEIALEALKSGVIGTTLGAALPLGAAGAAKLAKVLDRDVLASLIKQSAVKDAAQVFDAGTLKNKKAAERIIPELLKKPLKETFALTREGMQGKAAMAREAAGEALDELGTLKGEVSPQFFIDKLEGLKDNFMADGVVANETAINNINKVQEIFKQYGDAISSEGLRKLRRIFDEEVYSNKGVVDAGQKSLISIKKTAADEIRRVLASEHPDMAEINKVFSFNATMDDLLDATIIRKRPQKGLMSHLGALAGGIIGAPGGIGGVTAGAVAGKAVTSAMYSPAWKLVSAKIKNNIADKLARKEYGNAAEILSKQGIETPEIEALVKLTIPKKANAIQPNNDELQALVNQRHLEKTAAEAAQTREQLLKESTSLPNSLRAPTENPSIEDITNQILQKRLDEVNAKTRRQLLDEAASPNAMPKNVRAPTENPSIDDATKELLKMRTLESLANQRQGLLEQPLRLPNTQDIKSTMPVELQDTIDQLIRANHQEEASALIRKWLDDSGLQ